MRLFEGTQWDRPPTCERCGELEEACGCPPPAKPQALPETQTARIAVEKRKRGKLMTVVRGLAAEDNDLPGLFTELKNQCGAGGTVKDEQIEIQGDHAERIREVLSGIGYRVKS